MNLTLFMTLLVILSVTVSLITEAVKAFKTNYSANLIVLIVAIIVGAGGTVITYIFMGIAFTASNIICIALMALAVWIGAMVGYDKVLQMLEQIKGLK